MLLLATGSFIFSSCGGAETKADKAADAAPKIERAVDKNGKEYTSRWICPMRCKGSGTEVRGQKCPACKMDLVDNKNHAHYGHNH